MRIWIHPQRPGYPVFLALADLSAVTISQVWFLRRQSGNGLQLLTLGLYSSKQVLPGFIEGLRALGLKVGRQFFEIDSGFSKIRQDRFAVASVPGHSSG